MPPKSNTKKKKKIKRYILLPDKTKVRIISFASNAQIQRDMLKIIRHLLQKKKRVIPHPNKHQISNVNIMIHGRGDLNVHNL